MTCGECTKKGRCVDPPTPQGPNTVEHIPCWECGGKGCADCEMSGNLTLRACPMGLIDATTQEAMRIARYAKLGQFPEPGTWRDQLEIELFAMEFVAAEIARCQEGQIGTDDAK